MFAYWSGGGYGLVQLGPEKGSEGCPEKRVLTLRRLNGRTVEGVVPGVLPVVIRVSSAQFCLELHRMHYQHRVV